MRLTKTNYGELPLVEDPTTGRARLVRGGVAVTRPCDPRESAGSSPAPSPAAAVDEFDSKLEAAYAGVLQARRYAGEVAAYWHHPFRLSLATRCSYQPDFMLLFPDGHIEIHEVKGYAREDAIVKLKVAAKIFSLFTFMLVTRKGGLWEHCQIR